MKNAKLLYGFLIGLLAPFIIVFSIYLFKYNAYELVDYVSTSYSTGMLAKTIALGAILNLAVFMLFINLRKERLARGVLIATFILGLFIVYIKYLA